MCLRKFTCARELPLRPFCGMRSAQVDCRTRETPPVATRSMAGGLQNPVGYTRSSAASCSAVSPVKAETWSAAIPAASRFLATSALPLASPSASPAA